MADVPTWRVGDNYPPFTFKLTNEDGSAIDTSEADSVVVVMKGNQTPTAALISGTCTMTDAAEGEGFYGWGDDDIAVDGIYSVEWLLSGPGGALQTVPAELDDNPTIEIDTRLDGETG